MRTTMQYTLFTGFTFASLSAFIVMQFGTGFTVLTAVLYLYGAVCVLGGVIGHRRAYLRHAEGMDDPSLAHVLGLDALGSLVSKDRWLVELEQETFDAREISLSEQMVSVRRERDGRMIGISYPRTDVIGLEKG